jgi:hypothetical protein
LRRSKDKPVLSPSFFRIDEKRFLGLGSLSVDDSPRFFMMLAIMDGTFVSFIVCERIRSRYFVVLTVMM